MKKLAQLFTSNESIGGTRCLAKGDFVLDLQQKGNKLSGEARYINMEVESFYEDRIPIPCAAPVDGHMSAAVVGEVSGSALTFDVAVFGGKIFSGSFTSDLMSLKTEKCIIQSSGGCKSLDTNATIQLKKK